MKQASNPTGGPWFRVPGWLGGKYRENRPATEAEAWIELLGRWHQGEDVSLCELCSALQWGKGRVIRLHAAAAEWALANGATVPARIHSGPKTDRKRTAQRTGPDQEQPALSAASGPETDRTGGKIGPETDREPKKDSVQALVFGALEERDVEEKKRENTPALPEEEPTQPEADWDAIEAAILKARDAEIESYFTAPIQPPAPEPTTRKPGPDFGALFGKLTEPTRPPPAPEEEPPPVPTLPPDLDLLQMLTSRPDGAQGQPLAVAQRWHRALVTAGLTSPADLERYTLREIQMLPGMSAPSAGHVRDAVEAWGGTLAMGGRELVDSLRRRAFSGKLTTTPAEKRLMDAANIRPLDIRQMSDFDVHTFAQRLDQARSRQ